MVAERGGRAGGGLVWAAVVIAWLKLGSWFFEGGGSDDELRRGGAAGDDQQRVGGEAAVASPRPRAVGGWQAKLEGGDSE
jgi:hypothetical protein